MLTRRQFIKVCLSTVASIGLSQFGYQHSTSTGMRNLSIPVLLYHRIGHTKGHLTVTPSRFANDLKTLKNKGFITITLPQFEAFIYDQNVELPEKPVLVTFDDGYLDNYQNAFPILKEHGMVATFYIITGMLKAPERVTAANIREMDTAGMSFGSHTVSHRSLGELPVDEMKNECLESKKVLEDILGHSVDSISYPKGSYNSNTLQIVQEIGYKDGLTVLNGSCRRFDHPYVLHRVPIFSYDGSIMYVMNKRG